MKRWNVELCTSHAPWRVEFNGRSVAGWGVLSARDEVVAHIPQDIVHDEANARLIASAPDLLDALEIVLSSTCGDVGDDGYDGCIRIEAKALERARAAIAKAKGGAA